MDLCQQSDVSTFNTVSKFVIAFLPRSTTAAASFRMDSLNLLAVQGTLKSLLQYHNSKASILQCSDFFRVQLSHPYRTTGKIIVLT